MGADQPVDPYESDPLRLIAFRDQNQPVGATVVNVWICGLPEDNSLIDIDEAIDILKADYVPFITWLSGGRHRLDIRRAGTAPAIPYRTGGLDTHVCEGRPELHGLEKPWTAGAVLRLQRAVRGYLSMGIDLAQDPVVANIAWAGQTNRAVFEEGIVYLGSPLIGRGTVPTTKARFSAVGELYTPVNTDLFSQFLLGTPSVNRYSLGWIDPDDVVVHPGGSGSYRIGAIGSEHPQMLAFPSSNSPHAFDAVGVRLKTGFDVGLPQEGVEIIRVDQQRTACSNPAPLIFPLCTGRNRSQYWLKEGKFLDVGDSIDLDEFRLEVVERDEDSFVLKATSLFPGRFVDVDENNSHLKNIETIAAAGITVGCNRSGTRFCPDQTVTRAQMAAFILRAMGIEPISGLQESRFEDVDPTERISGYVEKIVELGIIPPRSSVGFDPGGPVTRADMAWFLVRAIDSLEPVAEPVGLFEDIEDPDLMPAAEALYSVGVTKGCGVEPPIYCPNQSVNRQEMASFLTRAFNLGSDSPG